VLFRAPVGQAAPVDPEPAGAAPEPATVVTAKTKARAKPATPPPDPIEQARADVDHLADELAKAEAKAASVRDGLKAATTRVERLEIAAALRAAGFGDKVFTRADIQALGVSVNATGRFLASNKAVKPLTRRDGDTPATYKLR
jgi:hypothetical protein